MIDIEVVYCPRPSQTDRTVLQVQEGCTVGQALAASGVLARHGLEEAAVAVGVWGRQQALDHPLRARDRVEVYRPLQCDPKEARRLRYRRQREEGARSSPKR
jgi:putative ubiquitin-RnfH superfamily antitoxin RatB of RatAB toxin-antitoxin module